MQDDLSVVAVRRARLQSMAASLSVGADVSQ